MEEFRSKISQDAAGYLSHSDKKLGRVIKAVGEYTIEIRSERFRSLVEAIIYQQLAGRAADAIFGRFVKIYRGRFPSPQRLASTDDVSLRGTGLSRQKITYLKDLSSRVSDGRLPLHRLNDLDDEQVVEELVQVKGVGRWTAEMFLIFCLGRQDVLPVGDLGLRRAMLLTYKLDELPLPLKMQKIAAPWKPYRSVATWYLWKSLEKFKGIG